MGVETALCFIPWWSSALECEVLREGTGASRGCGAEGCWGVSLPGKARVRLLLLYQGKNKCSPTVICFSMLAYAEGRMQWDLMNLEVELFATSDGKDFTCFLGILLYKHEVMVCFWEFYLFI